jgi:8-oxo-dGTP pyrophosphatase MutT (NUDIX family)
MKTKGEIEIVARGAYVQDGRLLVCHTRGARNTYLPGGHVDFDESARVSLQREVEEELGLKAVIGRFLGVVEHAYFQKGERHCEINLVFAMRLQRLDFRRPPHSREDHLDFRWIQVSALRRSDLEPAPLRRVLPGWLQRSAQRENWASTL